MLSSGRLKRRFRLLSNIMKIVFIFFGLGWAVTQGLATERINVVFFLIDDLGWTDLGCYGSDYYETPNVDRLAKEGMLFTDSYAASCVCSPTRVSILTGKYPGRLHITHAIPIQGAERIKEPLPLIEAIYKKKPATGRVYCRRST